MSEMITIPYWLMILGGLFAAWAILDRLLVPSVKWFLRRRFNIAIDELNARLELQLPAFKLTRRSILIDQLVYDPQILGAVEEYCLEEDLPRKVAMEKVERYAREIVPSFNAYLYFRFGNWLARSTARLLYRVRMVYSDEEGISNIPSTSSVVFVMNHRSNMDYILLAYLAVNRTALSYAVGEWARVWPVQQLVRALGAYFVRRNSGNKLYRRVLERYVQKATAAGVVQAVFPEGGLSLDGKMRDPKIGIIDYMMRNFKSNGKRDLVFIPVAVNYDRVLEDRSHLAKRRADVPALTRKQVLGNAFGFLGQNIRLMFHRSWYRFGYAAVNFGTPISMKKYTASKKVDFSTMPRDDRTTYVKKLADDLMSSIGKIIPVLPVSLVATVFTDNPGKTLSELEIKTRVNDLIDELQSNGAQIHIPRDDRSYTVEVGLRMLVLRHILVADDLLFTSAEGEGDILKYYSDSIVHLRP